MDKRKVVIFDIYKTLIEIVTDEEDPNAWEVSAGWLFRKGVNIGAQEFHGRYRDTIHRRIKACKETYPDVEIGDVFAEILKSAGWKAKGKEGARVASELALLFRKLTTKSLTIYPETKKLLQGLSGKVRMAIISNSQRLFTLPELESFDIQKYFEHIVFSSDIGSCKPGPKIFQRALSAMKVKPDDAVYVGDDGFDDIWGAGSLGMRTVWIDHGTAQNAPGRGGLPAPDAEVKAGAYGELLKILI